MAARPQLQWSHSPPGPRNPTGAAPQDGKYRRVLKRLTPSPDGRAKAGAEAGTPVLRCAVQQNPLALGVVLA
jgi:hypothetical protein